MKQRRARRKWSRAIPDQDAIPSETYKRVREDSSKTDGWMWFSTTLGRNKATGMLGDPEATHDPTNIEASVKTT
jgi:hypothetical protein